MKSCVQVLVEFGFFENPSELIEAFGTGFERFVRGRSLKMLTPGLCQSVTRSLFWIEDAKRPITQDDVAAVAQWIARQPVKARAVVGRIEPAEQAELAQFAEDQVVEIDAISERNREAAAAKRESIRERLEALAAAGKISARDAGHSEDSGRS